MNFLFFVAIFLSMPSLLYALTPQQNLTALAEALQGMHKYIHNPEISVNIRESHVVQVDVLKQRRESDCGFHALKNAQLLLEDFKKSDFSRLKDEDYYEDFYKVAKQKAGFTKDRDLEPEDMKRIVTGLDLNNIIVFEFSVGGGAAILVNDAVSCSRLQKFIYDFQRSENFSRAIVLGLTNHWITLLVHREGTQAYYVIADSLNSARADELVVQQVIDYLEGRKSFLKLGLKAYFQEIDEAEGLSKFINLGFFAKIFAGCKMYLNSAERDEIQKEICNKLKELQLGQPTSEADFDTGSELLKDFQILQQLCA